MWKRSQQHIITMATRYVIRMLARWPARLKCGYPCLSLLFLITDFAAVFSSPCDFHRWQNKCYHFEGMDHDRTSQRSPDNPTYIFSCCSNWMAGKSRSKNDYNKRILKQLTEVHRSHAPYLQTNKTDLPHSIECDFTWVFFRKRTQRPVVRFLVTS